MSTRFFYFGFLLFGLIISSCNDNGSADTSKAVTKSDANSTFISGKIDGAADIGLFVDAYHLNNSARVVGKANLDGNGVFEVSLPKLDHGVYRLRLGAKKAFIVLDGKEDQININGDLQNWTSYGFDIKGSPTASRFIGHMKDIKAGKLKADQISDLVNAESDPIVGMFVAHQSLGQQPQAMAVHQTAVKKIALEMPNSRYARDYLSFVNQLQQRTSSAAVAVGALAPDFTAPDRNGKMQSLSELKGQVVLLDFWASWCGPCRRENPNVVKVYDRYKDKGFTVMSVSLDGLDSRTASRMPDPEAQKKYIESSKDKWLNAIKQDNLKWDNHVSDLKKWESAPAATYGVRSIPATFLINKDGTIAATNLRGAAAIEAELKRIL